MTRRLTLSFVGLLTLWFLYVGQPLWAGQPVLEAPADVRRVTDARIVAGPGSRVPEPPIAFAWPTDCDYAEADGKLYVTDSVNRRIVVVRFDWSDEATCRVP